MKQRNDPNVYIQPWHCSACGVVIQVQMERGNGGLSRLWEVRCPICDKAGVSATSPTRPVILPVTTEV